MGKILSLEILLISLLSCKNVCSFLEENRLYDNLTSSYSYPVRPVKNFRDRLYLDIRFKLKSVQELNVKDQLLTLLVIMEQEWTDYKLKWDPQDYGGITHTHLPSDLIWLPDLRLYSHLGDYEFSGSFVEVDYTGLVKWAPKIVYKSFCLIEVKYYPFDIQTCFLEVGSWTHDGNQIFPRLMDLPAMDENGSRVLALGMDLKDYQSSNELELLSIPVEALVIYMSADPDPYCSFKFNVTLRRYSNFYVVNLITPLLIISFLSLWVFYLPADSGEKITLCVTILASQVMFLLLMMDNIPVTSLAVPLLGKIIIFNMILVLFSVVCTIIVLNIHFRSPSTHAIPKSTGRLRCSVIPKLLLLEVVLPATTEKSSNSNMGSRENDFVDERSGNASNSGFQLKEVSRLCSLSLIEIHRDSNGHNNGSDENIPNRKYAKTFIQKAMANIVYVRNNMKQLAEAKNECEECKFLASVLDRIFLITFNIAYIAGNVCIMMDAEALFDQRKAIDRILRDSGLAQPFTGTIPAYSENEMNNTEKVKFLNGTDQQYR